MIAPAKFVVPLPQTSFLAEDEIHTVRRSTASSCTGTYACLRPEISVVRATLYVGLDELVACEWDACEGLVS